MVYITVMWVLRGIVLMFSYVLILGKPLAEHPCIPLEDIVWLHSYMAEGVPFDKALHMFRRRLYPFMHDPYPWKKGNNYYVKGKITHTLKTYST